MSGPCRTEAGSSHQLHTISGDVDTVVVVVAVCGAVDLLCGGEPLAVADCMAAAAAAVCIAGFFGGRPTLFLPLGVAAMAATLPEFEVMVWLIVAAFVLLAPFVVGMMFVSLVSLVMVLVIVSEETAVLAVVFEVDDVETATAELSFKSGTDEEDDDKVVDIVVTAAVVVVAAAAVAGIGDDNDEEGDVVDAAMPVTVLVIAGAFASGLVL